jgi:hypothetical protein
VTWCYSLRSVLGSDETKKRCYVCTMAVLAELGHGYVGNSGDSGAKCDRIVCTIQIL